MGRGTSTKISSNSTTVGTPRLGHFVLGGLRSGLGAGGGGSPRPSDGFRSQDEHEAGKHELEACLVYMPDRPNKREEKKRKQSKERKMMMMTYLCTEHYIEQ